MSNCRRTRSLVGSYLYGDLRGKELRFLEGHLANCSECRAEFAAAESALALVPRSALLPSDDARARVLASVGRRARACSSAAQSRPAAGWLGTWGLAAAALMLGVLAGYQLPRGATPLPRKTEVAAVPSPPAVAVSPPGGEVRAGSQSSSGTTAPARADTEAEVERPPGQARPVADQTAAAERPLGVGEPSRKMVLQAEPVVRPPRPLGIDDVRVAEAVDPEVIR